MIALAGLLVALAPYANGVWNTPAYGYLGDQPIHLALSRDFAAALGDGEIPPAWSGSLSGGRGGPAFVLYPPLFFLLASVCSLLTSSWENALRMALLATVCWTFGTTYYLARAELSVRRSLLAATLVPLLPGVVLIGWGRGLLPNFLALGWMALLFGAGLRALHGREMRKSLVVMAGAAAGLVLTHALSSVMAGALIAVCLPVVWKKMGPRGFGMAVGAAVAAAVLTSWFWLPMLAAAGLTQTEYLAELHPYARSLWFGPEAASDGFSKAWAELNDFGLMVAAAQFLLAAVAALALRGAQKPLFVRTLPWAAGFLLLASVYPFGAWLAEAPGLGFLQFSWRWQGPFAFWCSMAMASVPRPRFTAAGIVFGLGMLFFTPLFTPASTQPPDRNALPDRPLTPEEYAEVEPGPRALYTTNLIEMRPEGVSRLRYPPAGPGGFEVVSGEAEVEPLHVGQGVRECRVRAATDVTLRLQTYAFPGWSAEWRGEAVAVRREAASGLLLVDLRAGEGALRLRFGRLGVLRGENMP